jgi:cytochrome oxidase assembly protein ShyY1
MRFGKLDFSPGLWPSVITLVVLGILIALGLWQLDRATQKRILLAGYTVDPNATVVQLEPDLQSVTDLRYKFARQLAITTQSTSFYWIIALLMGERGIMC